MHEDRHGIEYSIKYASLRHGMALRNDNGGLMKANTTKEIAKVAVNGFRCAKRKPCDSAPGVCNLSLNVILCNLSGLEKERGERQY